MLYYYQDKIVRIIISVTFGSKQTFKMFAEGSSVKNSVVDFRHEQNTMKLLMFHLRTRGTLTATERKIQTPIMEGLADASTSAILN